MAACGEFTVFLTGVAAERDARPPRAILTYSPFWFAFQDVSGSLFRFAVPVRRSGSPFEVRFVQVRRFRFAGNQVRRSACLFRRFAVQDSLLRFVVQVRCSAFAVQVRCSGSPFGSLFRNSLSFRFAVCGSRFTVRRPRLAVQVSLFRFRSRSGSLFRFAVQVRWFRVRRSGSLSWPAVQVRFVQVRCSGFAVHHFEAVWRAHSGIAWSSDAFAGTIA